MRVRMAMLADFALAHQDGKIYILGGGIEIIRPDNFQYTHPTLSLVSKVEFAASECGRAHTIEVHPLDADGKAFDANLRRERLTLEEVLAQARIQQISSLDDIRWAVLEKSGQISFIQKKE